MHVHAGVLLYLLMPLHVVALWHLLEQFSMLHASGAVPALMALPHLLNLSGPGFALRPQQEESGFGGQTLDFGPRPIKTRVESCRDGAGVGSCRIVMNRVASFRVVSNRVGP